MEAEISDAELVRRIASGSDARAAETLLFRRFARRIELYGRKHLGDPTAAQDLVHEVLMRVLTSIRDERLHDPARLTSFVLGTCRNVSADLRRGEQRQRRIELHSSDIAATFLPSEPEVASERDVKQLLSCLNALAEREAGVVRMSFLEDREPDDICARLGVSAGNLRVIRCRALVKLAECMGSGRAK